MLKKTLLSAMSILMSASLVYAGVNSDFNSGLNNQEELVQAQADAPVPQATENDKGIFDWVFKPDFKELVDKYKKPVPLPQEMKNKVFIIKE